PTTRGSPPGWRARAGWPASGWASIPGAGRRPTSRWAGGNPGKAVGRLCRPVPAAAFHVVFAPSEGDNNNGEKARRSLLTARSTNATPSRCAMPTLEEINKWADDLERECPDQLPQRLEW